MIAPVDDVDIPTTPIAKLKFSELGVVNGLVVEVVDVAAAICAGS